MLREVITIVLLCVSIVVYGILLSRFVPKRYYTLLNLLTSLGVVGLGLFFGLNIEEMGLYNSDNFARSLMIGILISVFISAGVFVASFNKSIKGYFIAHSENIKKESSTFIELFYRIPFGTALSEELIFRGVMLGLLLSYFSVLVAVVVSAVVFGLWHVAPTLENIRSQDNMSKLITPINIKVGHVSLNVITTFVAGVAFACSRIAIGTLIVAWLVHTSINGSAIIAGRFHNNQK